MTIKLDQRACAFFVMLNELEAEMPKNLKRISDPQELLEFVSEQGVGRLSAYGYSVFWNKFMPVLFAAAKSNTFDPDLLADCYYVAADVFDFMQAPRTAIIYYRKALLFDPSMAAAHRELSSMFDNMGDYANAIFHSDKALFLGPNERYALRDREHLGSPEDCIALELFEEENPIWRAHEFLAIRNPQSALDCLKGLDGDAAKRALTYCYGALGDSDNYLKTWKALASRIEYLEFTHADWFYMHERDYYNPDIWKTWLESRVECSGIFEAYAGLDKSKLYKALSTHESIRARMEYLMYSQSGDQEGLDRLFALYPEWTELSKKV